jgi:hypothetical protein
MFPVQLMFMLTHQKILAVNYKRLTKISLTLKTVIHYTIIFLWSRFGIKKNLDFVYKIWQTEIHYTAAVLQLIIFFLWY